MGSRGGASDVPARPRVLLIRPDHLGDVLMASPTVELLRRALPEAHLAMMVGPWSEEVARRDPLLDEVVVAPFPGFTRAPRRSALDPYRLLWRTAAALRPAGYDAALLLRFDHWWGAWLAALAGIPLRIGYGVRECRPFLTHCLDPVRRGHWVEQSARVALELPRLWGVAGATAPSLPVLRFGVGPRDEAEAARLGDQAGIERGRPVVALHPGTGSALKLWPEDRWIALGRILAGRGARVLVTGSSSEAAAAQRIADAIPGGRSLAGQTELGPLAALFRSCDLVVGVDSGPLHLAVAIGSPTIHLFGPTDPAVYGPWGAPVHHRVVTGGWPGAPCGRLDLAPPNGGAAPCMGAITVEQVAGTVLSAGF